MPGGRLVVRGAAGLGKTTLLREGVPSDLRVAWVTATASGRGRPFSAVAGLIGFAGVNDGIRRALEQLEDSAADAGSAPEPVVAFGHHLASRLALVIDALVIDDAQWLDHASAVALASFADAATPVAVLVAHRPLERKVDDAVACLSGSVAAGGVIDLEPLTSAGLAELLAAHGLAWPLEDARRLTGGVPLFVELLPDRADASLDPAAANPTLDRLLAGMSPSDRSVLCAVAVCDSGPTMEMIADVAGVTVVQAEAALDALANVGLLNETGQVGIRHPLLAELIERSAGAREVVRLHGRAARHLHDRGADAVRIVGHLSATTPVGAEWAARAWAVAAGALLVTGALEEAAAASHRGLAEEPADTALRADLLLIAARAATRRGRLVEAEEVLNRLDLTEMRVAAVTARVELVLAAMRHHDVEAVDRLPAPLIEDVSLDGDAQRVGLLAYVTTAFLRQDRFAAAADLVDAHPAALASTGPGAVIASMAAWFNACLGRDDAARRLARLVDIPAMADDQDSLATVGTVATTLWVIEQPEEAKRRFDDLAAAWDELRYRAALFAAVFDHLDGLPTRARERFSVEPGRIDWPLVGAAEHSAAVLDALASNDDEALGRAYDDAIADALDAPASPTYAMLAAILADAATALHRDDPDLERVLERAESVHPWGGRMAPLALARARWDHAVARIGPAELAARARAYAEGRRPVDRATALAVAAMANPDAAEALDEATQAAALVDADRVPRVAAFGRTGSCGCAAAPSPSGGGPADCGRREATVARARTGTARRPGRPRGAPVRRTAARG